MTQPTLFASPHPAFESRRSFLKRTGQGAGLLALAGLLDRQGLLTTPAHADATDRRLNPLAPPTRRSERAR